MCDQWMPQIDLPLTSEQFAQLPRNAAYKYEYLNGRALLTPRPRHFHALLDLRPSEGPTDVTISALEAKQWPMLVPVFMEAFESIQPFAGLTEPVRSQAVHAALERTRTEGDGPLIAEACLTASRDGKLIGAVLVTLLPDGDPCDLDSYEWLEPPPADCIRLRLGRPHLTWVFVAADRRGQGVGSALLNQATRELLSLGFKQLLSTFMLGNNVSMLWHWRQGFRLLSHPGSYRLMRERWRRSISTQTTT
jgi:GNAT superfamily N-acetyltransferase